MKLIGILGAVAALTVGAPAHAQEAGPIAAADGKVQVSLVTDVDAPLPDVPFRIGVRFQLAKGWHLYWKNPGQSGLATEVTWSADQVQLGALQWPAPERITSSDDFIVTYGWHGDVVLLSEARTTKGGTVRATADFLVCEAECIPGRLELARRFDLGDGRPARPDVVAAMVASAARVPRPAAELGLAVDVRHTPTPVGRNATFTTTIAVRPDGASTGALALPGRGVEHAFFPERTRTVTVTPTAPGPDGLGVVLTGKTSADDPGGDQRLAGVLALERAGAPIYVAIDAPLPRQRSIPATVEPSIAASIGTSVASAATFGLLEAIALAFLGGLLLNLMPCVLPVLAIKVGGLVRLAGERAADRARHAGAYAAGIVASLVLLAIAVLAFRAAGTRVGWGFQFQAPGFLVAVGGLLVVLATNAFGVLELGIGANALTRTVDTRSGLVRTAGEGVLAVVLATPCSAPFLGSAVGFALAQPAPVVLAVFVSLGLGLAAPVGLLAVIPGARRILPRPGPWMAHLKQVVGLALLAAAVWLAWIVGRGFGVDAMARVLAFWLAVAVACWLVGTTRGARRRPRVAALAVAVAVVAGTGVATLRFDLEVARAERAAHLGAGWEAWSEDAVARHLAAGRAVFVDFTADWCLTCKVNERVAIETAPVRALATARGIAMMKADWTFPDDAIRGVLARHGKAGVPMYLVYGPVQPDPPEVLPELLTTSRVLAALEAASRPR